MNALHSRIWLLIALSALVACAQLGLETPQTFDEKLAYGYSQNAAIRLSAAQSLKAGVISKADATNVLQTTDAARAALDGAKAASGAGDTDTALARLQMATTLLTGVQTFLQSRGVK